GAARAEAVQTGLMQALTGVFIALVALVGGRLVLSGSIGLGELVAAVGLALFIPGPLQVISWMAAEVARSRASAGRVAEVLATPGDIAGTGAAAGAKDPADSAAPGGDGAPRGSLRLSGLVHEGLDGVDLTVAPGEFVGVVVTEPAHADTLVRCLARRVDPDAGRLELDGVPFTDLAPRSLRSRVLVAEHGAELFAGSLRDNITAIGASTHPAAAAARADEVAASLPGGLDAPVGERGRSLSGGQRQRVALARALAADRDVLVVHDPTTAIDAATESRIATGIRELRRGRTTILVTSSPALLAVADRVALIDGGRLADEAPHEELVRRSSLYRTAVLA
uniref:ATP-binding cassette domain-containing protein n=1 Tax=Streptomyces kanamyceticus TaxID=1967 RepID=UPI000ABB1508